MSEGLARRLFVCFRIITQEILLYNLAPTGPFKISITYLESVIYILPNGH